jgi:hypothetical protein
VLVGTVAGQPFSAQVDSALRATPQSVIHLSPMPGKLHLFDATSGLSLRTD